MQFKSPRSREMKILILAPFNYADARHDLQVLNYSQKVDSAYYLLEGLLTQRTDFSLAEMYVYLASQYRLEDYDQFDVFYGLVPRYFEFDMIICYNKDVLSVQENLMDTRFNPQTKLEYQFYTSDDATHFVDNIYEVIKLAKL